MKPSRLVILASVVASGACAWAADATSPLDLTQRNAPFAAAGATISPDKQTPSTNATWQEKRVETRVIEKRTAPLSERRAAIDVTEAREKNVREKDSRRPETIATPTSAFNQRKAAISTGADTTKPPTVAKYQDSLKAASASNMARFPAVDRATSAKINRFVFRKNPPDPAVASDGKTVTPAAGGSAVQK